MFEGRLDLRVAAGSWAVTPGMLVWLPRDSAFTLSCTRRGYRGVFAIARSGELPAGAACAVPASQQLLAVAEAMRAPADASQEAQRHLAAAFLGLAGLSRPATAHRDAWAERLRMAIEAHLGDTSPVQCICADWPISYRQLARRFTAVHGTSPKAFQIGRRLHCARERLRCTSASVTDVALDLGFSSSQHFASCFRRHFGHAPSDARGSPSGP